MENTLTSHNSGGWGVHDRGACRFQRPVRAHILVSHLLAVTSHGRGSERSPGGVFYAGTNSHREGSTLMTYSPSRVLAS